MNTENTPTERQFLKATSAMMDAVDVTSGMSAYELTCFKHNFEQFIQHRIDVTAAQEKARRYPMGRKDWGKDEPKGKQ